jgi:hypothetical protein
MNWGGGGCKDSAGCLFTENVRVKDSEKTKKKNKKKVLKLHHPGNKKKQTNKNMLKLNR